jgi:hypothetical protein
MFISQKSSRRNLMVGILHGGFVKFQKPLDLAEEHGSYENHSPSVNIKRTGP